MRYFIRFVRIIILEINKQIDQLSNVFVNMEKLYSIILNYELKIYDDSKIGTTWHSQAC